MNPNSVPSQFVIFMVKHVVNMEIVQRQMFALVILVGLVKLVKNVLHFRVAKTDTVKNLWNVFAKKVGPECFVTKPFVMVVNMALVSNQVIVFAILDGPDQIVMYA